MKKGNQPRRQFIKKSALFTAGAVAGFNITGNATPDDDGIIGHGGFTYRINKNWATLIRPKHRY